MAVTEEQSGSAFSLRERGLTAEIGTSPLRIDLRRDGSPLISDLRCGVRHGSGTDHLIHLTEGVIPEERVSASEELEEARVIDRDERSLTLGGELASGSFELRVRLAGRDHVVVELEATPAPYRYDLSWRAIAGEPVTGLGARHGETVDQSGRHIVLGADRRYTGPDCPPDMLEQGGIPQGDYAPAPWLLSRGGWAAWAESYGAGLEVDTGPERHRFSQRAAAGTARLHLFCAPSPAARLRQYLRLSGMPALLPEWGYGHWKSRDVYEHQRDVEEDFDGYAEHGLPLDAIVIDSPWETQYNTWRFDPQQFPDPRGLISRMRGDGVRTVVWVTPWVNLESSDGQRPPGPEAERRHERPAENYSEGALAGHYMRGADGKPWVGKWWMGTGSVVDFTSSGARRWWNRQARGVLEMGVEGIKADDGEGYYVPPDAGFSDGRTGAEAAWAFGELYRRTMQDALDETHPGEGVLFGRSGWSGQQSVGHTWGGDQASDFWSLRTLVAASLTAAASGFSNWSHDVGGYLGKRLAERCPKELLLRWAAFGALTPLMQAHGRFAQEAWRYATETLDAYRRLIVLHETLVPYIRAAAATAQRSGLPIIRPLCLIDPDDPRGWSLTDAYGFGPALWVAPVLEEGAIKRTAYLPRGEWIDFWSGEPVRGGREVTVDAPLDGIPLWVRRGSLVLTYSEEAVRAGLGDSADEKALVATLWGRPPLGRALARLAGGAEVRWESGHWYAPPGREISFAER